MSILYKYKCIFENILFKKLLTSALNVMNGCCLPVIDTSLVSKIKYLLSMFSEVSLHFDYRDMWLNFCIKYYSIPYK